MKPPTIRRAYRIARNLKRTGAAHWRALARVMRDEPATPRHYRRASA